MKLHELQKKLDVIKYLESEKAGKDLCGTYTYCKHCNKKNKYPCAAASRHTQKKRTKKQYRLEV